MKNPILLYPDLTRRASLLPSAASLTAPLTGTGEASLTLSEHAPEIFIHDWLALYTQKGFAGYYRVSNITRTYRRQLAVTLLHGIDILADSVWSAKLDFAGTKSQFLTQLLAQQTHLINGVRPWVLGVCEDSSAYERSINYDRLSELRAGLEEEGSDYYFVYDQSVFPWTVNYVRKPAAAASEFRLARNISNVSVTYNDADLCTRLILSVNAEGEETEIRTYNNASAQADWGIVTKTADYQAEDETLSADSWAQAFLARRAEPSVQIQIDGAELSRLSGDSFDELSVGTLCRVALPAYHHTFLERIVSVTYPDLVKSPARVTVSLANQLPRVSESIAIMEKAVASASSRARSAVKAAEQVEQTTQQQYQHYRTETNQQLTSVYKITGVKLDANGKPIYQQAKDAQGNPLWETDEQGNYVLDEDGNRIPIYVYDEAGNPVPVYDPDSTGSISSSITQTAQSLNILYEQTGGVTEKFDPEKQYHAGDYVLSPNGVSCRFKVDHLGPWSNEDVVSVPNLQAQITTNAVSLQTVYTKTGINSLGEGVTLKSMIDQTADSVGMVVEEYVDSADGKTKKRIKRAGIISAISNGQSTTKIMGDVIELDGTAVIKAINGAPASETSGEGQEAVTTKIGINASHILLTGDTLLSGHVTVEDGHFIVTTELGVKNATSGRLVTINDGKVSANTIQIKENGSLIFADSAEGETSNPITVTKADFNGMIKTMSRENNIVTLTRYSGLSETIHDIVSAVSVANNTLTITKADGTSINFKKATTLAITGTYTVNGASVTAGWSSGTYTVVATQTNYNTTTEEDETTVVNTASTALYGIASNGDPSINSTLPKYLNVPLKVTYDDGDAQNDDKPSTGLTETISVNAEVMWEAGRNATNVTKGQWQTVTENNQYKRTLTFTTDALHPNANAPETLTLSWNKAGWDYDENDGYQYQVQTKDGSTVIDTEYVSLPSLKTVVTNPTTKQNTWWKTSGTNANKYVIPGTSISAKAYLTADSSSEHDVTTAVGKGSDIVIDPTEAINYGFDVCHDSIGLSASTQTLAAGTSLTIYPKAKASATASSASNITTAGITITAEAATVSGDVDVTGPDWAGTTATDSRKVTFSPASGNGSPAEMTLTLSAYASNFSWANGQYTYTVTGNVNDGNGVKLTKTTSGIVLTPTDAINYGKTLVNVSSATLSNIVANSSTRTATASLTIYLDNNKSKTVDNVDVSSIYQAGLDGSTAITNKNFSVKLADNNGNGTVVKTDVVSVDVRAVYQKGVDDATPSVSGTYYVYASNGGTVNMRRTASSSGSIIGQLYPRTEVSVTGESGNFYAVTYGSYSGYMSKTYLSKTNSMSPTNYGTNTSWKTGWYFTETHVAGVYYTGSGSSSVVNFANVWVYYTTGTGISDTFTLAGSWDDCNYQYTMYQSTRSTIRSVESDDERLDGKTVYIVFDNGYTMSMRCVFAN